MPKQHPLSTWLETLRARTGPGTFTAPDLRAWFTTLARAPKFWVQDHDALPPYDQVMETLIPPMPYNQFLLGTHLKLEVTDNPDRNTTVLLILLVEIIEGELGIEITLTMPARDPVYLGSYRTKSFTPAETTLNHLDLELWPAVDCGPELFLYGKRLLVSFLALLAAENVSISTPPSCFARKREFARINAGKRVENYHIHHLKINRKHSKSKGTGTGKARRGHWRCAHLRHYRAGVGHIKVTKTIAIAPVFAGDAADTIHKDYIV